MACSDWCLFNIANHKCYSYPHAALVHIAIAIY